MATPNYNLPTITGNMAADVVRDMNALAEATDSAIKEAVDGVDLSTVTQQINVVDQRVTTHLATDATTMQKGHVKLSSSTTSTSETEAATPKAVKTVNDALTTHLAEKATLTTVGHTQLSSATNSDSEALAATPKAVKTAMDRADAAFTQANDIKGKWASVVGNPLASTDTQAQLTSKTQAIKSVLATNLTNKGQPSAEAEPLSDLAGKVANIIIGRKWASGIKAASSGTLAITGLSFKPSVIVMHESGGNQVFINTGIAAKTGVLVAAQYYTVIPSANITITTTSFTIKDFMDGGFMTKSWNWVAYE